MGIHGVGKANRDMANEEKAARDMARAYLPSRKCPLHDSQSSPPITAPESGEFAQSRHLESELSQQYKERMVKNGWCFHQVNHLAKVHSLETLSYLSTLKSSSHRLADHERCIHHEACIAYNVDITSYKTQHINTNCSCQMVLTPYSNLIKIIRSGSIPLISIEGDTDTDTMNGLGVYPRTRESTYLAISHVWADGLGNPSKNALPLCQIKRLKANILALKDLFPDSNGPMLFWMDTLCIPVEPENWSLRLLQIDKMASIYKGAISSLVLDAELMSTELDLKPTREGDDIKSPRLSIESRARIACSAWMCRSWTLQEGRLPPTITIQFLDNAMVLGRTSKRNGKYRERSTIKNDPPIENSQAPAEAATSVRQDVELATLDNELCQCGSKPDGCTPSLECDCVDNALERTFYSMFFDGSTDTDSKSNKTGTVQLVSVWNELSGRSTTKPSDIILSILSILDFETRKLHKYHDTGQMFQAIILSLGKVPLCFFFNRGSRQDQAGSHQNRWVPSEISKDALTLDCLLTVHSSHLSHKYLNNDSNGGVAAHTINTILPLNSKVYLRFESGEMFHTVEPSDSIADHFRNGEFTSTCIIVEDTDPSDVQGTKRAACFYVRKSQEVSHRSIHYWWQQARQILRLRSKRTALPIVAMTFISPLQPQRVKESEAWSLATNDIYSTIPITTPCELRINYDPLPGFKALKRRLRDDFDYDFGMVFQRLLFFGCLLSAVFILALGISRGGVVWIFMNPIAIIILGAGFTAVFGLVYIQLTELSEWRYIRSFEKIASSRPLDGAVKTCFSCT